MSCHWTIPEKDPLTGRGDKRGLHCRGCLFWLRDCTQTVISYGVGDFLDGALPTKSPCLFGVFLSIPTVTAYGRL